MNLPTALECSAEVRATQCRKVQARTVGDTTAPELRIDHREEHTTRSWVVHCCTKLVQRGTSFVFRSWRDRGEPALPGRRGPSVERRQKRRAAPRNVVTGARMPQARLMLTKVIAARILRAVAVLATFGVGACQSHDASHDANGAATPLNVASVVAGCTDLDDCNRQCTEQDPNACVSAGHSYEFGHGVPADPARAFQLYEQACDWKFATGCYNAAVLLEAGKGVVKDAARARQLYAQVCALGAKTACEHAGKLGDESTSSL
jgi:hypothetical protein